MNDQDKMTVHFLVSKLVIFAVPLLNNALAVAGIQVATSPGTVDALTNNLCIALGLAYSWWAHRRTREVHADLGYSEGAAAGFRHGVTAALRGQGPAPVSQATSSVAPTSAEPVARRSTAAPEAAPLSSPPPQPINTPIPPL